MNNENNFFGSSSVDEIFNSVGSKKKEIADDAIRKQQEAQEAERRAKELDANKYSNVSSIEDLQKLYDHFDNAGATDDGGFDIDISDADQSNLLPTSPDIVLDTDFGSLDDIVPAPAKADRFEFDIDLDGPIEKPQGSLLSHLDDMDLSLDVTKGTNNNQEPNADFSDNFDIGLPENVLPKENPETDPLELLIDISDEKPEGEVDAIAEDLTTADLLDIIDPQIQQSEEIASKNDSVDETDKDVAESELLPNTASIEEEKEPSAAFTSPRDTLAYKMGFHKTKVEQPKNIAFIGTAMGKDGTASFVLMTYFDGKKAFLQRNVATDTEYSMAFGGVVKLFNTLDAQGINDVEINVSEELVELFMNNAIYGMSNEYSENCHEYIEKARDIMSRKYIKFSPLKNGEDERFDVINKLAQMLVE